MPAHIDLQADIPFVNLSPGESAEVRLALTNRGDTVDRFTLVVTGIEAGWYTLSKQEIALFPQDTEEATLLLQPPPVGSAAGVRSFSVVAISRDNPEERAEVQITLILAATSGLKLDLEPRRVHARRAIFTLKLRNEGNAPYQAVLAFTDPEEALLYTLGQPDVEKLGDEERPTPGEDQAPPLRKTTIGRAIASSDGYLEHELEIPPFSRVEIPVLVRPSKRIWTGKERQLPFDIGVHPPGVEWEPYEARRIGGMLIYPPVFAMWAGLPANLRRALVVLLPLLLLLMSFLLIQTLRPGSVVESDSGTGNSSGTATAVANATGTAAGASASPGTGTGSTTGDGKTPVTGQGIGQNGSILTNQGVPFINGFWLVVPSPDAPPQDQPQLEWDVTSAEKVDVSYVILPVDSVVNDGTFSRVDYSLVATGTLQVSTNTLSVLLVRPPNILMFRDATPAGSPGGSALVEWSVQGGRSVTLNDLPAGLDGSGRGQGTVTTPGTHTHILCASNPAGRVCRSVRITVAAGPTATPALARPSSTPTRAPTFTPTSRSAATVTRTRTRTPVRTATRAPGTNSPTVAATQTRTSISTATAPVSATTQRTYTPTNTQTITPTSTTTLTTTGTSTRTVSATQTRTPTGTYTVTATASPTQPCVSLNYTVGQTQGRVSPGTIDIGNHCDNCTSSITLPFPVRLYDRTFTTANVSSNGTLQFTSNNLAEPGSCMPAANFTYTIFAYGDDLSTTRGGIYTSTEGSAPNRIFNVEWRAAEQSFGCENCFANFEVRLYEGQGRFDLVYNQADAAGRSALVGVQKDSASYTQYSCNQGRIFPGQQLVFILPPCITPTVTPCVISYRIGQSVGSTIVPGTTDIGNHCDNCGTNVQLPFPFTLYDQNFNAVYATSNGVLQFNSDSDIEENGCLPDNEFSYSIMPYWDDLRTDITTTLGSGILTSVTGQRPNRTFNIEWRACRYYQGATCTGHANFEVRLYEQSSRFEIIYGSVPNGGDRAAVGVQRDPNNGYTQFSCNQNVLTPRLKLDFTLVQCGVSGVSPPVSP